MLIPGDVLVFKRNKPISRAVRLIEGNPYIHAAVVVRSGFNNGDAWVSEINTDFPSRVVPIEISKLDGGTIDVFRNPNYNFNPDLILDAALKIQRSKYNYWSILQLALNHLIGRVLGFFHVDYTYIDFFPTQTTFVCSTEVSYLLSKADPNYKFNPNAEPDDYCKAPWVKVNESI